MSKARNLANLLSDGAVGADELAPGASLPSQSGQSGKYLTTDGTTASWDTVTTPTPAAVSDQANTSTGYFDLPAGTTAQRPGSPASGMVRFNTSLGEPEWYDPAGSQWLKFSQPSNYTIQYLVVGGGGGGSGGAGGGAGGMLTGTLTATPLDTYPVTIGLGGAGITDNVSTANNGFNSSLGANIVAIGGGGGGTNQKAAGNGGSGGGGWHQLPSGGLGTSGQGNNGGSGATTGNYGGGGGGGAGQPGANGTPDAGGGVGGDGLQWSDGNFYAGGGGGANYTVAINKAGGAGGGGSSNTQTGGHGVENTGGGGGGVHYGIGTTGHVGGNGGKGIVILRYSGTQRGTGGTVTQSGGYTYHTFTSSGTFTA